MKSGMINFELSDRIDKINEDSIRLYSRNIVSVLPFLKKEVIEPITEEIKNRTGYSDENIPKEEIQVPIEVGKEKMIVKVTPTTKRPGYEDVYSRICGYLDDLEKAYKDSREQEGMKKIEGVPYIDLPLLINVLYEYRKRIIDRGVKQELLNSKIESRIKYLAIPVGLDFSKLPHGSLEMLQSANKFHDDEKRNVVERLESLIFEKTGFWEENIPKERNDYWNSYGRYYVHAISSPKETIAYGNIVNTLVGEGTKKTAPGELILLANRNFDAIPKAYEFKEKEGRIYIALSGTKKRIKDLLKGNTNLKINQVLKIYSF